MKSKALAENLAVTSVKQIAIPEAQLWLLDLSATYFGIQKRTRQFLDELNHPYSNLDAVLSLMRQSILADAWLYLGNAAADKALQIIQDIFEALWVREMEEPLRIRLLNQFLEYSGSVCESGKAPQNFLPEALDLLASWQQGQRQVFAKSSGILIKFLLTAQPPDGKVSFDLARSVLRDTLEMWRKESQLEKWWEKNSQLVSLSKADLDARIGQTFYLDCLHKLDSCKTLAELAEIPHHGQLCVIHREMLNEFGGLAEKTHYLFYLMNLPAMEELQEHLLYDLNRLLQGIGKELNPRQLNALLDSVFAALKDFRASHNSIVLDCVLSLAKALIGKADGEVSQRCIRRIIDLGFTPPGAIRIRSDWQLEVDTNHIKNIRTWLEIIGLDPALTKDLMAALIINLTQKGVFISDTDLFQKDVSAFLNTPLAPLIVQAKHLLRIFPVFYNEIGAEGEIRDISTEIDELSQRRDRLIHFLRKQVHTESNNTHIILVRQILKYWLYLDPKPLAGMVPADVEPDLGPRNEFAVAEQKVFRDLLERHNLDLDGLLSLSWQAVSKLLPESAKSKEVPAKRLGLLLHTYYLLLDKYRLDPYDIVQFLGRFSFFDTKEQARLRQSLSRSDYDSSVRQMLEYIKRLNAIVLDPKPTQPWENIYYKRHIAAGIPSMYGSYREPKLEAMGMIFRLENVIKRSIEKSISQINLSYINAKTLRRITRILEIFQLGLRQEGFKSEAFANALGMLESCSKITNLSLDQYLDIFNLLKDSINEIIDEYFYRFYESELAHFSGAGSKQKRSHQDQQRAEDFYRKLLSSSFLVQEVDNFVAQIILSLNAMKSLFSPAQMAKVMSYDPDLIFVNLNSRNSRNDNPLLLGSKAFFLKQLQQFELPVPPAFVISTELFRHRDIINAHPGIELETDELLRENIARIESQTGLRYGDPEAPLLFSVRSGAPMSLPGAMDTFLNIGLNDEITLRLSKRPNFGWTSWDCYRRLIQSWGMAYNIDRDEFDAVMIDFKRRYKVKLKTQFSPAQMRKMCDAYKAVLASHGVTLEQDPFLQIKQAIVHVLDSWNTERAVLYRQKLHIADEWGTAVTVQKMVLGNISLDSGSGVLFTHADYSPAGGINLNGDFTLCSQGEDVVAGLVYTLPISEEQRKHGSYELSVSLQKDYPAVYQRLLRFAGYLINDKGYPHQEMEFTFESPQEDSLYILQTRNQVITKAQEYTVFAVPKRDLKHIGSGIGIGKGVVNGLVAFSRKDIDALKEKGLPLILVRPDTVPDDMELLFDCQGLLTSRGGVTSHAAVTATRLGLVGVVNCRQLKVLEAQGFCRIGEHTLSAGDPIAIDAGSGMICLGHYPIETLRTF